MEPHDIVTNIRLNLDTRLRITITLLDEARVWHPRKKDKLLDEARVWHPYGQMWLFLIDYLIPEYGPSLVLRGGRSTYDIVHNGGFLALPTWYGERWFGRVIRSANRCPILPH